MAICAAIILAAAFALIAAELEGSPSSGRNDRSTAASRHSIRYLGVYEPDAPSSYSGVDKFAATIGKQPNIVGYYSGWGEPFQLTFAEAAASHGAATLVQMDPAHISLATIAAGGYNAYLISFAHAVASFGHPVIICFGHEMNGFWYSWGYRHTNPTTFVAAWRYIVTIFRKYDHANNVKWLWQVNSLSQRTGPVRDWWPGTQYVTYVGISGYYFLSSETFRYIFGPVFAAVRKFTQDPVLIAETGVGPSNQEPSLIKNLFTGLLAQHDIGLVWFDQDVTGPLYKGGHWRLEGNRVGTAAFRGALEHIDVRG